MHKVRLTVSPQIFIFGLFFLAFLLRLTRLIPNMELITTSLILSSVYLSRKHTLLLTLVTMAATDLLLGNTNIFLFTWSGFLLPILFISLFRIGKIKSEIVKIIGLGLGANLFFFIWTNFGVWALDSWGMYPKTLPGLVSCYINALPFLKNQICSTLLFLPLFYTLFRASVLGINQLHHSRSGNHVSFR